MSAPLVTLLSLMLSAAALGEAVLAAVQMVARREATSSAAWPAAVLGVLSLTAALAGGSIQVLDLVTVAGVVLLGGVAGAGWAPHGRRLLLGLGLLCLAFGLFVRLESFSGILSSVAAVETGGIAWGLARSAGFIAFLCATGAVLLGVRRPARLPVGGLPARIYALHRALGIASILALAVHLIGLRLDTFVEFGWEQLLLYPWTSAYRPLAITLGWLAMLALLLTAASGGLRRLLPGWRVVHALAYLTFALGLAHGLLAGTDTGSPWAISFYLTALLAVGWTTLRKYLHLDTGPNPARGRLP